MEDTNETLYNSIENGTQEKNCEGAYLKHNLELKRIPRNVTYGFITGIFVGLIGSRLIFLTSYQKGQSSQEMAVEAMKMKSKIHPSLRSPIRSVHLDGFLEYECGIKRNVFCCRRSQNNDRNQTYEKTIRDHSRWYTADCDTFSDGFTCCYFFE